MLLLESFFVLQNYSCYMVHKKTHDPCNCQLEQDKGSGDFFASGFPVDGGNCCRAGDVQQTEHHQGISIGGAEAHRTEKHGEAVHPMCTGNILYAK